MVSNPQSSYDHENVLIRMFLKDISVLFTMEVCSKNNNSTNPDEGLALLCSTGQLLYNCLVLIFCVNDGSH